MKVFLWLVHIVVGLAALLVGIYVAQSESFSNLLNKDFIGHFLIIFSGGFLVGGSFLLFGAWKNSGPLFTMVGYVIIGVNLWFQWYLGYL